MFKKITSAFLALTLLLFSFAGCSKRSTTPYDITPLLEGVGVDSKIAYVVRRDYQTAVFSREKDLATRPGALNHVMIALLTLEKCPDPTNTTTSPTDDTFASIGGGMYPNIDMVSGETYSIADLLNAMLLGNAYDAANLLTQYIGGDAGIAGGIEQMNLKAKEICQTSGTNFVDPNGLTPTNQYTTASDFYKITDYLLTSQPSFINYFKSSDGNIIQEYTIPKRVNQRAFTVTNYNPFTSSTSSNAYSGATGIAYSSYEDDSGKHDNLITLVTIGGYEYVAILLNAPGIKTDSATSAIYNPNPSSTETSSATTSDATTSSDATVSGDTASLTSEPVVDDTTATTETMIFSNAREIFSWIQNYTRWVPYPTEASTLYEVQMDSTKTWENMTVPVGLDTTTLSTSSDIDAANFTILCIGPTTFSEPLVKNDPVGQATIVNLSDKTSTTTANLVALSNTQSSTILQFFVLLIRIVVILAIVFLILIIIIRFRNIQSQKRAVEAKRNRARKMAMDGHTVDPYAPESYQSTSSGQRKTSSSKTSSGKKSPKKPSTAKKKPKRPPSNPSSKNTTRKK